MKQRRTAIWHAWTLAVRTQFRLDLGYGELLGVMGIVVRLELTLIMYFGDTVPDLGVPWTLDQRYREVERRLARLRWLQEQQDRERTGLRGLANRVRGRKLPSGKELYQRMQDYADQNDGDWVQSLLSEDPAAEYY